jgi:hypothetical protein
LPTTATKRLPTAKTHPGLLLIVRRSYFPAQGNGRIASWLVIGKHSRTFRTVYALGKAFRRIPKRCGVDFCTHRSVGSGLHYLILRVPIAWRALRYQFDLKRLLDLSLDPDG